MKVYISQIYLDSSISERYVPKIEAILQKNNVKYTKSGFVKRSGSKDVLFNLENTPLEKIDEEIPVNANIKITIEIKEEYNNEIQVLAEALKKYLKEVYEDKKIYRVYDFVITVENDDFHKLYVTTNDRIYDTYLDRFRINLYNILDDMMIPYSIRLPYKIIRRIKSMNINEVRDKIIKLFSGEYDWEIDNLKGDIERLKNKVSEYREKLEKLDEKLEKLVEFIREKNLVDAFKEYLKEKKRKELEEKIEEEIEEIYDL